MSRPIIAALRPVAVDLKEGHEYYWCRCGLSASQPFCDGSHVGTDIAPLRFKAATSGPAHLCQCKGTAGPPLCDGSHARMADLGVGDPVPARAADGAPAAQPTPEEPTVALIHEMARNGLSALGRHGEVGAMGVPRSALPHWDDIQILTAQMAVKPLPDDASVATELTIGPRARGRSRFASRCSSPT